MYLCRRKIIIDIEMEHKKITFDTFIRGCLSIAILVGIIMLLN